MSMIAMLLASTALLVIALFLLFASYIFSALALYTMAKNKGIDHAWLAWIPIANGYLFGELINDTVAIASLRIPYATWILPIGSILVAIFANIGSSNMAVNGILSLIGLIFTIYSLAASYRLFKLYKPESATLYIVLSIVFFWLGFLSGLFMFICRNNTPNEYLS